MNVMVYNKYKELLVGLNLEVMKSLEGVYNVDEIIDTFSNFYYDKMILDITAIRDYQNIDNLQKLAMNINMENVILLLDNSPETDTKTYLSKLISIGIYNFTKNVDGINYLLVHPHTYKDVVNIHNISEIDTQMSNANANAADPSMSSSNKLRIIGLKNVTPHAGATTLSYLIEKNLHDARSVTALEVNKRDFSYFNNEAMISSTSENLLKDIMKRHASDVIIVDLNDYTDIDICTEVYYLIEPSTIMINRLLRQNKNILEELKNKKIILNKCSLNSEDIATFEYETKLNVFCSIQPVDDRQPSHEPVRKFISKLNL